MNGHYGESKALGLGAGSCKGRLWNGEDFFDWVQGHVKGDYGAKKAGTGCRAM